MASDKQHSPEIERALTRQNASFAVLDEAELAHLIHMARCAAERLHWRDRTNTTLQSVRDVLAALRLALETADRDALDALAKPALKQIAAAHLTAEGQFGDGSWPIGFDASWPHLRVHGSKALIGRFLLDTVLVYHPEVDHPEHERNQPSRELAERFADFVVAAAELPISAEADAASAREKILELCPQGPVNDIETDAVNVGEALGMSRKDARNAVDAAAKSSGVYGRIEIRRSVPRG